METFLNELGRQTLFRISEPSEIAAARRAGNELGRKLGFDETRTGQLAILITEASTNILKHAEHGEILLRPVVCIGADGVEINGVEVTALDAGPGMINVSMQMTDGQSSAGTYGVGLGAIKRLAQELDIYSRPNLGTVLAMLIWSNPAELPAQRWEIGAVCLPLPSEDICGDSWRVAPFLTGVALMMADGLGHGPDAAAASQSAVAVVNGEPDSLPARMLERAHLAGRGSRGSAAATARIDCGNDELRYCGVGNIAGCIYTANGRQHLLSHNGIVGSNIRKVQEFVYPWQADAMLILHSDGLSTRWELSQYPGLADCHPSVIAAVLYRDFCRKRDDATVLVLREKRGD